MGKFWSGGDVGEAGCWRLGHGGRRGASWIWPREAWGVKAIE